jgi:peptidyl-prolyl cis-trans isomerase A (cyclophilin A)
MSDRDGIHRRGLIGGGAALMAAQPAASLAAGAKPRVLIKTSLGKILIELEDKRAPITCANFLRYVDIAAYDGGFFFRAAHPPGRPNEGQIVGGANPHNHPFPPIEHEPTTKTGLKHVAGTVSIGRFQPGSAQTNFFICATEEPYLDAHPGEPGDNLGYAAFGHVLSGMNVVRKILASPTGGKTQYADQKNEWLKPPIPIVSMRRA